MTERMTPDKALAAVEHRFVDLIKGFGAWVIFFGPQGGEAAE